MSQQPFRRPPYLDWRLDRWKIGVAVVLFALLVIWRPQAPAPGVQVAPTEAPALALGTSVPSTRPTRIGPSTTLPATTLPVTTLSPPPTPAVEPSPTQEAAGRPLPTQITGPPTPPSTFSGALTLSVMGQPDGMPLPINTPFLFGESVPFGRVQLWIGERELLVLGDDLGRWHFALPWPLPVGMTWVRARLVDGKDRPLSPFASRMVIIGPRARSMQPPVITPPLFDEPLHTSTPVISGEGPPGMRLFLYAQGLPDGEAVLLGETQVDAASGRWHWTPTTPLAPGAYEIWAAVVDAGGRPLTRSEGVRLVIDADALPRRPPEVEPELAPAPSAPTEGPVITALLGLASSGARLFIYVDGEQVGETRADGAGAWRFDFPAPVPGSGHDIRVVEVDATGRPLVVSAPPFLPVTGGDPETHD